MEGGKHRTDKWESLAQGMQNAKDLLAQRAGCKFDLGNSSIELVPGVRRQQDVVLHISRREGHMAFNEYWRLDSNGHISCARCENRIVRNAPVMGGDNYAYKTVRDLDSAPLKAVLEKLFQNCKPRGGPSSAVISLVNKTQIRLRTLFKALTD